ncbi:hypothetical protein V1478_005950 [Vespula squamosa]|uniref:Uncharacterized protein n=1 Tax=Vespula squamosa TaxID=30214 RepID=A0ABD2BAF9_VESSQ
MVDNYLVFAFIERSSSPSKSVKGRLTIADITFTLFYQIFFVIPMGKKSMCESLEYSDDRLAVITMEHACFASGTSLETSMTGSEKTELFQLSM